MHLSTSNFEDQFIVIDRTPSGGIEFGLTHNLGAWKGLQR